MSWREVLGLSNSEPYPQYPHNPQNPAAQDNFADIADSAEQDSKVLEVLSAASQGLPITLREIRDALAQEDIEDWRNGEIDIDTLAAFTRSLVQRREMDQGIVPDDYTERATCKQCGPVWLWFAGEVLGCPWCWNRRAGRPIPRPRPVRCADCMHFERTDHPNLGHCAKEEPESITGLWSTDPRSCSRWQPRN